MDEGTCPVGRFGLCPAGACPELSDVLVDFDRADRRAFVKACVDREPSRLGAARGHESGAPAAAPRARIRRRAGRSSELPARRVRTVYREVDFADLVEAKAPLEELA